MSCYNSNKPPTPSLNLRHGVSDTSSLRLHHRSDLDPDASSLRLYNRTSVDRDAGSLVLGNHEASRSLVQGRSSVHPEERMRYEEEMLELRRQIETTCRRMGQTATPRTDNPDAASASTADPLYPMIQEEIDDLSQILRERLKHRPKRVKDELIYGESSVNEHAELGAGVAKLKLSLKEFEGGSEELQGLLRELPRRTSYREGEHDLGATNLDLVMDAYGSGRNGGSEREEEDMEESKRVPLDEVGSMEYKVW